MYKGKNTKMACKNYYFTYEIPILYFNIFFFMIICFYSFINKRFKINAIAKNAIEITTNPLEYNILLSL